MATGVEISVSELTQYIRYKLEQDARLRNVKVKGEISNLTRHSSGHWYFTLKDRDSQISCALFKGAQAKGTAGYLPEHGHEVIVIGDISVYPPRGAYQLIISSIRPAGLGDLNQQFMLLKQKLQTEGLFDPFHKKELPKFPAVIGVITSLTGAVLRDIIHTLRRRWPATELHIAPAKVQGEGAVEELKAALDLMVSMGKAEVIIMGRGGGSMEDLWPFNDESLARKVFDCPVPIISAVGHETDFTILDFVADMRAPTPTAAAEIAVPNRLDYLQILGQHEKIILRETLQFTLLRRQMLDDYNLRIQNAILYQIERSRNQLENLDARMQEMDMRKILSRGYSIILKNKKRIQEDSELKTGDRVKLILSKGSAEAIIEGIVPEEI